MTMRQKLWFTVGLMWLGMILVVGWMALEKRDTLMEQRVNGLKSFVGSAQTLVERYVKRAEDGEFSVEEAKNRVRRNLSALDLDGSYVYAFDGDLHLTYHPKREIGTDMSNFRDDNGDYFYRNLKALADDPNDGTLKYDSTDDDGNNVSRINYVRYVPEWDWYLASNVYVTDIQQAFWASVLKMGLIVLAIGLAVTAVMAWVIRNVIADLGGDPREARDRVRQIAEGDLTTPLAVKAGDDRSLLSAIEGMRAHLAESMTNIRQASTTITVGVGQIHNGNQDLASRTDQQAASIGETASSMEELTQTVRQNADNARQASGLAGEARTTAKEGGDMMDQVVTTMQGITDSSRQVTEIVGVIDSIAFQTNILALNASVEAARAGEQGRGFAVVANEVRTLASRSADASREIRELIDASNRKIGAGSEIVSHAGETIRRVVDSVARMTDLIEEISVASSEQSNGIDQVNEAIVQMDQVTQQNASLVQEATTAAATLNEQVATLERALAGFKVAGVEYDDMMSRYSQPTHKPTPQLTASAPTRPAATRAATTNDNDDWESF
ncbi:methyl-accepting chemotaxis protein [Salinicola rhizosphaerae]|uniref:Methyl-accepting chemotaxis protein n=1 Tax=Salinicola rhizosphaerae TaxID=1443141 RepID=A0ABQ3DS07_9GAMM|nr:methyl-accepting chemotaxis protein [Salinicola rhizosphaerae]GHB13715.1 methyl-accepting chemotaxis protein [Salinicola rhizosphaerae]